MDLCQVGKLKNDPSPLNFVEFGIHVTLLNAMQKLSVTSDHANMMCCMMYVAILVMNIHDKTNIWNKMLYIAKNQVEFDVKYYRISYAITSNCCSFSTGMNYHVQ